MKNTRPSKTKQPPLPAVTLNPALDGKYDDQPLFQDKVNRANHILKTVGLPKFS